MARILGGNGYGGPLIRFQLLVIFVLVAASAYNDEYSGEYESLNNGYGGD